LGTLPLFYQKEEKMDLLEIDINNGLKPNGANKTGMGFWTGRYSLDKRVFVELWQRSNSLNELENKIEVINRNLFDNHVGCKGLEAQRNKMSSMRRDYPHIPENIGVYMTRANSYRKRGVPLKELNWKLRNSKQETEWDELADYAQKLLDK
jgi:hypothetical protein